MLLCTRYLPTWNIKTRIICISSNHIFVPVVVGRIFLIVFVFFIRDSHMETIFGRVTLD